MSIQQDLEDLTVVSLKKIAKSNGLRNYSRLRKADLIAELISEIKETQLRKEIKKFPKSKRSPRRKKASPKRKVSPRRKKASPKRKSSTKNCIQRSLVKLNPHQIRIAKYLETHRGVVAAFDVGSGKTLTAIAASQCVLDQAKKEGKDIKVLVITPKSLRDNFKKEMIKYGLDIDDPRYTFYTYFEFYYASKRGEIDCNNTFLIVDEAHSLKKIITKKQIRNFIKDGKPSSLAFSVINCAIYAWKVLLLTATPVPNRVKDVINLVAMVRGEMPLTTTELDRLLQYDRQFKEYFGCYFSFYTPPKTKNFPKVIKKDVKIEMTPEYYKQYKKLEDRQIRLGNSDPWIFYNGLRQASNELEICLKCDYVNKVIEKGRKTLIYSAFKSKGIEMIEKELKKKNIPYLSITGDIKEAQRQKNVNAFNDPKGPNVLFITNAGAQGLDLKGVRDVIIFESVWNESAEEQIIGRAVRFGSHAHLPKSEQNVKVHRLIIVKPRKIKDKHPSADVMLNELSKQKATKTKKLIQKLKEVSIENMDC